MEIKYSNVIVFLVIVGLLLGAYYRFMLTADNGEDKKLKMLKRVLSLVIILGIVHIYSITDDIKLKQFFIVILAVLFNMYSVFHSTNQCNFPRMYVIRLCLYSAAITFFIAGLLWYTTHNSLFGFMVVDETAAKIKKTVGATFSSKLLGDIDLGEKKIKCPDPDKPKDYAIKMAKLSDPNNKEYYNLQHSGRGNLQQLHHQGY